MTLSDRFQRWLAWQQVKIIFWKAWLTNDLSTIHLLMSGMIDAVNSERHERES